MESCKKITAKEKIEKALVDFIKEGKFPDVTVSEVVQRAGVGKSTFYCYYHDIYDVFENLVSEFVDHCAVVVRNILVERSLDKEELFLILSSGEGVREKLPFTDADEVIVRHVLARGDLQIAFSLFRKISDMLTETMIKIGSNKEDARFYADFFTYSGLVDSVFGYVWKNNINFEAISIALELLTKGAESND